jgi:hypothetical protein
MVGFYRQRGRIPGRTGSVTKQSTFISNTAGSFTRSSAGSFRTGATSVSLAATDVLRFQNLGDGNGANAFYEGSRVNINPYSHSVGSWVQNAPNNIGQNNIGTAPDGTVTAGRVFKTGAGSFGPGIAMNGGITPGWCLSAWVIDNGGTAGNSARLRFSYSQGMAIRFTIPAIWTYLKAIEPTVMANPNDFMNFDQRVNVPKASPPPDPVINTTTDILTWGCQLEVACMFPSSTIITTGLAGTRAADTKLLTTAQYSSKVLTDPSQGYVIPEWDSTNLVNGNELWLYSFGGSNSGVRFRKSSGDLKLECVDGGAVQVASNALTLSANQRINYIIDPADGQITVSNATAGNGTVTGSSWAFDSATCRIAGVVSGTSELFGAISDLVSV